MWKYPSWIPTRFVAVVLLLVAVMCLSPRGVGWAASCEPEADENPQSIEELVGPIREVRHEPLREEKKANAEDPLEKLWAEGIQQKLERELAWLTSKLQTSLDDTNLWLSRARVRTKLGRREAAISDLTEALERGGESAEVLTLRGELWGSLNEFSKAETDLNKAVQLAPDDPAILFARGKIFLEQWKTEKAYHDFSKAIEINPKHTEARFHRAYLLLGVKFSYPNGREAAKDLKVVVDADPQNLLARYHYTKALWLSGDPEEAVRQASYVIAHDPDSDCMYLFRFRSYLNLKKYDLALQDATRYMEFQPNDPTRIGLRAQLYTNMEKFEEAITDWTAYIQVMPENSAAYYHRANAYQRLRRHEEAVEDWTRLTELEPHNSDWLRFRGLAKSDLRDYDGALADINAAIQLKPDSTQLVSNRANIYDSMGEHAKAWAAEAGQTALVKAYVGKTEEYKQEQEAARQALTAHVDQQIAALRKGERFNYQVLRLHDMSDNWGTLWLDGLTSLLADPDEQIQRTALQTFRTLIERNDIYPFPAETTAATIDILNQYAAAQHPQPLRNEAATLAKVLAVLQVINDPATQIYEPSGLTFRRFSYAADEEGRSGKFTKAGRIWLESKNERAWAGARYREIKRTPTHVDLFCLTRALYVRLEPTQARWSGDRKNWKPIGPGETAK